jgi:rhodanese-related sulfurtransferase
MNTLESLSPREAYAAYIMGSVLVDVREPSEVEHKSVGVKKLVNMPFSELDKRFGELPEHQQVVFVSNIGIKSKEAAKVLLQHGYDNVATVDGGLKGWEEEGLPVK